MDVTQCKMCFIEIPKFSIVNGKYENKNKPRKFCSKSCGAKYQKIHRKIKPCIKCGIDTDRDKYCVDCYKLSYIEINNNWNTNNYLSIQKPISQKMKRILLSTLGSKCSCCGYSKHLCSLVFHHTNQIDKSFTLDTSNIYKKDIILVLNELDKCELLCQNCHCIKHQIDKTNYGQQYAKRRELYIARKLELIQKFNNQCQECNFKFNISNLSCAEFHHIGEKLFHLSAGQLLRRTTEEINSEIAKCILLCKNCHMSYHYK